MEFTIWLIFIASTLLFLITLALVNCAELPEDQTPEGKKIITPLPKVEKAGASPISKQKIAHCTAAAPPPTGAHGKGPHVKKSVKNIKKQKTLPKAASHGAPVPSKQTLVAKSQRSISSGILVKSKVSRSQSTLKGQAKLQQQQLLATETKSTSKTMVIKSTVAVKEQEVLKPGAKPKLPYYPELGPLLVDQQLYENLKKKYDMSTPSTTDGKSSSISHIRSGSDGSSHLSRFKTQSFGGSLSKCSTKLDLPPSAVDGGGGPVEKSKKESLVKGEAKQPPPPLPQQ